MANTKFIKPSLEELESYRQEKNLDVDCEYFLDFYEANGWKAGRVPMKDWKATMRNWHRRKHPKQEQSRKSIYDSLPEL